MIGEMAPKTLGQAIRSAIEMRGYTMRDFAKLLGVHKMSVYNWAKGRCVPDTLVFRRICLLLEVRPNDLLSFDNSCTECRLFRDAAKFSKAVDLQYALTSLKRKKGS